MSTLRFNAIEASNNRKPLEIKIPKKLSQLFNENVFSEDTMREYLSKDAFNEIKSAKLKGTKIQRELAEQIAVALKDWALSKGATHYTHWFQPLTGITAEKHVIEEFYSLKFLQYKK